MNKKGQIYLIVSLIIGLVIFVLTSQPNTINITPSDDDFKVISQNYNQESSQFLASLIKDQVTDENIIQERFTKFSVVFTQYAKSRNPSFGLIYLLNYNGKLYMCNFLDKRIEIKVNPPFNLEGCYTNIPAKVTY